MKRVLIVDDDDAMLFVLRRIVTRRGWEPLAARSGAEALALLDRADVVVTDFCMPGMNGLELVRAIRQRDETVPVILVTAEERLAGDAWRAGAYDYLAKPFDVASLGMALDRALEARHLRLENRRLRREHATG